jgi:hypothetical protein
MQRGANCGTVWGWTYPQAIYLPDLEFIDFFRSAAMAGDYMSGAALGELLSFWFR